MMGMLFLQSRITSERVRLACRHWTRADKDGGLVFITGCQRRDLELQGQAEQMGPTKTLKAAFLSDFI